LGTVFRLERPALAYHKGRIFILELLALSGDEKTREFLLSRLNEGEYSAERSEIKQLLERDFPIKINALERNIQDSGDLDLLWTEFLVTGNRQAIVRIIEVLERPDRIREKFQGWLKSKPSFSFLFGTEKRRKRVLDKLQNRIKQIRSFTPRPWNSAGIVCDVGQGEIITAEDLDCLCSLEQLKPRSKENFQEIIKGGL